MKFSNGYWLVKEGLCCSYPQQVFSITEKRNGIEMIAATRIISQKGDTLEGPSLTYFISSPMKDVIKVKIQHYKGALRKEAAFDLNENQYAYQFKETKEKAVITSGGLSAVIDKAQNFSLSFKWHDRKLTSSFGKSAAYIKERDSVFLEEKVETAYMREQLSLDVDECIYGFGERFTPFVKNGQSIEIWNADGGTASDQAYKNIPFYMSNKGYGVFVNHTGNVSFEVASEKVSKVQFSVQGESLEYYVIGGEQMKQVLSNYTLLSGRPNLPAAWSFGLWLSTSFTTDYDEETVMHFVDGMKERNIPLSVFHFDSFWMKAYHWCDFKWDETGFSDARGMLRRLHEKGLKVCVWINPYIAQASELFDEGMQQGYFLKRKDGSIWQCDLWQPGMAIVDFTNENACKWYQEKLSELIKMGVDCFKTDFGERIPVKDVVYANGCTPESMHNYYTYLYNRTVYEVLKDKKGKEAALVFARSATAGSQKFPVHWGGDCEGNYPSMAESLRGGLSLGLSGFGFWSHDIGGFENTSTADVYKRWVAFGLMSSHSRLHGSSSYRVPWLYDEEAVKVLRYFTNLKCHMMPYLYSQALETFQRGIPMMRAMVLEFSDDPNCAYLDKQYMLGEALLVAPIFNEEGKAKYYIPEGRWTNFFTGEVVEGGKWQQEVHDYYSMPLWVRPGSIVALGKVGDRPDYDYSDGVKIGVYELEEDRIASGKIVDQDGRIVMTVAALKQDKTVTIQYKGGEKPWEVILKNIHKIEGVSGGSMTDKEDGIHIKMENESEKGSIICYL